MNIAAGKHAARFHHDGRDPPALLSHARRPPQVQPLAQHQGHLRFIEHLAKNGFGHVRLESPHGVGPATVAGEALGLLAGPCGRGVVIPPYPPVELAAEAADHAGIARVGHAQAAAREPADVPPRLDQEDGLAHAGHLDRGRHAGRGSTVDHHVTGRLAAGGGKAQPREHDQAGKGSHRTSH